MCVCVCVCVFDVGVLCICFVRLNSLPIQNSGCVLDYAYVPLCVQDGAYFLALVDSEQNRLQQHCCRIERHLEEPDGTIPEEG